MSGFSYGGAIQLVSAAIDPRIDAIVPDGIWHSLPTTFLRDGAVAPAGWQRSAPAARRPRRPAA